MAAMLLVLFSIVIKSTVDALVLQDIDTSYVFFIFGDADIKAAANLGDALRTFPTAMTSLWSESQDQNGVWKWEASGSLDNQTLSPTLTVESSMEDFNALFQTFDESINVYGTFILCQDSTNDICQANEAYGADEIPELFQKFAPVQSDCAFDVLLQGEDDSTDEIVITVRTWLTAQRYHLITTALSYFQSTYGSHADSVKVRGSYLAFGDQIEAVYGYWARTDFTYTTAANAIADWGEPESWDIFESLHEYSGSTDAYTFWSLWLIGVHSYCSNEDICSNYGVITVEDTNEEEADDEDVDVGMNVNSDSSSVIDDDIAFGDIVLTFVVILIVVGAVISGIVFLKKRQQNNAVNDENFVEIEDSMNAPPADVAL